MTDGWDDVSAFGYRWKGGGREQLRLSARNSGLFFIAATEEVLRMMTRLKRRMETEGVWDQTAYNEEMWYMASNGRSPSGLRMHVDVHVHVHGRACART